MSILATCATCQSQFKAPDHVAGRRTRCPRCGTPIDLPPASAPPPAAPPAPPKSRLPPPSLEQRHEPDDGTHPWLLAAAAAGISLVIVLGMVLAAKLMFRASPPLEMAQAAHASDSDPPEETKADVPGAETKKTRAERLAEHDMLEKETLAELQQQVDRHKPALERLRKEEDDLFRKPKFAPAKVNARTGAYLKDLSSALPPIQEDLVRLARKRDELAQARRKILFEQPEPDDAKLEDYVGLYLTPEEIADLGKLALSSGAPRPVAQRYLQQAEAAGAVARPIFAGLFNHESDKDLTAVTFHLAAYRGKAEKDTTAHVLLHRLRGAWSVLELPGRNFSVILGMPPAKYKRAP
jgi:hypothetical protein